MKRNHSIARTITINGSHPHQSSPHTIAYPVDLRNERYLIHEIIIRYAEMMRGKAVTPRVPNFQKLEGANEESYQFIEDAK